MNWLGLAAAMFVPPGATLQPSAPSEPGTVPLAAVYSRWERAIVQVEVARSLTCSRSYRMRQVEQISARLDDAIARVRAEFTPLEQPLILLEPWRGDRPCGEFREAAATASQAVDELEAIISAGETRQ